MRLERVEEAKSGSSLPSTPKRSNSMVRAIGNKWKVFQHGDATSQWAY